MSDAAALSGPPSVPAPQDRDGAAERVGGLLIIVRWLIGCGRQLAGSLPHHAASPNFPYRGRPRFGTIERPEILALLARGLQLATALEARLLRRAAKGLDVPSPKPRLPRKRPPPRPPATTTPATAMGSTASRDAAPPGPVPLLTARQIAARLRNRPIGALLVEICCDLGLTPGQFSRTQWDDLTRAIVSYGGSLSRYFNRVLARSRFIPASPGSPPAPIYPAAALPEATNAALCTGPP